MQLCEKQGRITPQKIRNADLGFESRLITTKNAKRETRSTSEIRAFRISNVLRVSRFGLFLASMIERELAGVQQRPADVAVGQARRLLLADVVVEPGQLGLGR